MVRKVALIEYLFIRIALNLMPKYRILQLLSHSSDLKRGNITVFMRNQCPSLERRALCYLAGDLIFSQSSALRTLGCLGSYVLWNLYSQ
jgi:hypothetical protein